MTLMVHNFMKNLNWLDYLSITLILVGGLNWGLIGFFNFDLVSFFCFDFEGLNCCSRFVYGLVGLSTVYLIFKNFFISSQDNKKK
jgi:uncharacterized membrane protein YuzA (DUF378 family)